MPPSNSAGIGEQPQRWRGGRKGDQPRYRCVTHTEQAARIGHPACRLVLLGPCRRAFIDFLAHDFATLPLNLLFSQGPGSSHAKAARSHRDQDAADSRH